MLDDALDLARTLLKQWLLAVLWDGVLFNVGRIALLACTLGRYPRGAVLQRHAGRISLAGCAVLLVLWAAIALHNQRL